MQFVSRTNEQPQGYSGKARSPIGLTGAIVVHAVVVGAIVLMPKEIVERFTPPPIFTYSVPADPPPPEPHVIEQATKDTPQTVRPTSQPDITPTIFPLDTNPHSDGLPTDPIGPLDGGAIQRPADPPPAPVLADAQVDPRFARDFQPTYPPAMQRAQEEGKVTVRVRIGTDGRVSAVEKLFATNDAFWEATQAQALRKWRFRAATRDGVPVEGSRVMTLHFRLD